MRKNKKENNEMLIQIEQKYIRMTPRKIRLVAKAIKNLEPLRALEYLEFLDQRAAKPLAKAIKQAIAAAVNNYKLDKNNLQFDFIDITEGAVYKRWQPISRGRAHHILKRTSNIKIRLKLKDKKIKIKAKKQVTKNKLKKEIK